jgi:hypothetical protein
VKNEINTSVVAGLATVVFSLDFVFFFFYICFVAVDANTCLQTESHDVANSG